MVLHEEDHECCKGKNHEHLKEKECCHDRKEKKCDSHENKEKCEKKQRCCHKRKQAMHLRIKQLYA